MIKRVRQWLESWWIRLRSGPDSEPELEHPPDCEGCEFMKKYGPWQPPQTILTSGIPVECLLIGYEMTADELDDFAESCGLKVLRKLEE
jgi:hypothetical protein